MNLQHEGARLVELLVSTQFIGQTSKGFLEFLQTSCNQLINRDERTPLYDCEEM